MHLFTFEPGDGRSYRVLFGRMSSTAPDVPFYTVFGVAKGSGDPGLWSAFETEQISEEIFANRINGWGTLDRLSYWAAWRLWLALTGQEDDTFAAQRSLVWSEDWRRQLPAAAME